MDGVLMDGIRSMPMGWQLWVFWLMIVNTASIAFLKHKEARFCLAMWIPNGITMMLMAEYFGYVRLLGLSHVMWRTPLVAYLFLRREDFDLKTRFGKWAVILLVTNAGSLVVDYADVVRYAAGDREDQRPPSVEMDAEEAAMGDDEARGYVESLPGAREVTAATGSPGVGAARASFGSSRDPASWRSPAILCEAACALDRVWT